VRTGPASPSGGPDTPDYHLGLRSGLTVDPTAHHLTLRRARVALRVRRSEAIRCLVKALVSGNRTQADLLTLGGDPPTALQLQVLLGRLDRLGWLTFSLRTDEGTARSSVTTVIPIAPTPDLGMAAQRWAHRRPVRGLVRLSRFAYARWLDGVLVLRSPLSSYEIRATGPALANMLSAMPVMPDSPATAALLDLLHRARMTSLVPEGVTARPELDESDESDSAVLRQWEFHDLLFHTQTRDGRDERPSGGTFRFVTPGDDAAVPPLPAVHPSYPGDVITLPAPASDVGIHPMSLVEALGARRSIRSHGAPIDLERLGVFLYHSARLDAIDATGPVQVALRPYPSGGGLHELELYVVANRCEGLVTGLYHYRAAAHTLCRVAGHGNGIQALLDDAGYSMGHPQPQVLIVITSRFQRIAWKYEAIAYSLTLKHVGCLLQTMYLVATVMGLAPCAIGGGNSEIFARVAGLSPLMESSVSEFSLGTCGPAPGQGRS
jgi:oxazoline/thiazoline dehydrogenase